MHYLTAGSCSLLTFRSDARLEVELPTIDSIFSLIEPTILVKTGVCWMHSHLSYDSLRSIIVLVVIERAFTLAVS